MKKNDVFTFTAPNGVEVTAVCLMQYSAENCKGTWYYEYLCYAQNRLFTLIEKVTLERCIAVEGGYQPISKLTQDRIIVDYAVLPDYDKLLKDYAQFQQEKECGECH